MALRHLIRARSIDIVQVGGLVNPHAAIAARLVGVGVVRIAPKNTFPLVTRKLPMQANLHRQRSSSRSGRGPCPELSDRGLARAAEFPWSRAA
jgi:hypothetical protein